MTQKNDEIINTYTKKFSQQIKDFHSYWFYNDSFRFSYNSLGVVHTPYKSKTFNIGSDGFRSGPYKLKNLTGRRRIAFFGSSALVGIPIIGDEDTIAESTRRHVCSLGVDVEVLNLGVISYNIQQELILLLKVLVQYEIDYVVLFDGYNDAILACYGELWSFMDIEDIMKHAFHRDRLKSSFYLKNALNQFIENIRRYPHIRSRTMPEYLRKRRIANLSVCDDMPIYYIAKKAYLMQLEQFFFACRRRRIPVLYCLQPTLYVTNKHFSEYERAKFDVMPEFGKDSQTSMSRREHFRKYYLEMFEKTKETATEYDVKVFDADSALSASEADCVVYYDYCHLTKEGCDLMGQGLAKILFHDLS